MKYLFSTDNTNLIITLDTESGKYNPEITTINDPNITLENDRIWFYENGKYIRNFSFDHVGTISGVTPTSIADAFAKLNVVIDGLYLLVSPNFKGSIVPTDTPTGTEDAVWIATQAGTYTNFGGKVVSANSRAEISRVGGVFSISQTTLVVPNTKIPTWTATSFASGDQVNHLGKDWVSNAAIVAGDVPGTSSKWVERLTAYSSKTTFNDTDNANPSTMKSAAYHIGDKNLINKGFSGYGVLNDADLNVLHNAIIFCRFYWNTKEVLTAGWTLELLYVRKSDGLVQLRLFDAARVNQRSFSLTFTSTVGKQYLSVTDSGYVEGQFVEFYIDWDKVPTNFSTFSVPVYVNYNSLVDFKGFNYLFDNRYNTKFDERIAAKNIVNTTALSVSEKNAIMVGRGFMPGLGVIDADFARINNAFYHLSLVLPDAYVVNVSAGEYIALYYMDKTTGIIQFRHINAAGTTLKFFAVTSAIKTGRQSISNYDNGWVNIDIEWDLIPAGTYYFGNSNSNVLKFRYVFESFQSNVFNKKFDDRLINVSQDWSGKKFCSFGDSITGIGNTNDITSWQMLVKSKLGFGTHYGRGIGGTSFKYHTGTFWANADGSYAADGGVAQPVGTTSHINALCTWDRISTQIPTDSDLVFLMGGTNDWNGSNPIGDTVYLPSDTTDTLWNTYKGAGDFNVLSFKGGLAAAIVKIQTRVPNAVLVIGTLLSGAGVTAGVNMIAERVNGIGLKPSDYRKATIEVANEFGIPVVDVFSTTGINQFNRATYIADEFHPYSLGGLNKGNKALSRAVCGGLSTIKPNF